MADNIIFDQGSGTLLATNEVDGVQVLRVKPQIGGDGEARDVAASAPLPVVSRPGRVAVFRYVGLRSTPVQVKDVGGEVVGWHLSNVGETGAFVKLYDDPAPSVGSTAAAMTLFVPAGAAVSSRLPAGVSFGTAISVAATTGGLDTSDEAPPAGQVIVNLFFR